MIEDSREIKVYLHYHPNPFNFVMKTSANAFLFVKNPKNFLENASHYMYMILWCHSSL